MNALRPYLKAILPALLTLVAVAVQWAATGAYDKAELATTITGLVSSLITFLVSNGTPVAVKAVPVPARKPRAKR